METHFELITQSKIDIRRLREAFKKKAELEKAIVRMIKDFEQDTGLAIDMVRYQRDITIPIVGSKYTDLSIVITPEED